MGIIAVAAAMILCVSFSELRAAGVNQDCVNNGIQGSPFAAGNGQVTVSGGQVSGAGATLFIDFFRAPSSTNDWIDVDGDGLAGNFIAFPFVDNLGTLWPPNGTINTHWMFQYRSVGSVNGFNEFVESQTCNAIPLSVPAEAGLFNQFEYATLGVINWAGPFANSSGTPVQPCEIEFSFLDVPSAWAVQVQPGGFCLPSGVIPCDTDADCAASEKCVGAAKWNAEPGSPGYGLNPIVSSTGYVSQLQSLARECGSCAVSADPCTEQKHCAPGNCVTNGRCNIAQTLCGMDTDCPGGENCVGETATATVCRNDLACSAGTCSVTPNSCRADAECPVGETCSNPAPRTCENLEVCTLSGNVATLNVNTVTPDADTLFDFIGATVPVAYIANRGTGLRDIKYSEMQFLFGTGRLPSGENYAAATRSVGSGTRNAIMNSTGIDTSWGRGDNVGNESATTNDFNLGSGARASNAQGSGQIETAVENFRLGVGYTGLAGPSRAASDALGGRYEVLNVCKDVDTDGNPLCDCTAQACAEGPKFCSITTAIPCTSNAECNPTATNGTCVAVDAAIPNAGYVRPTISSVLDNCNECCGYTIGGNGSFVVRGNRHANRDPLDPNFLPGNPLDNQAVADYLNNIDDSVDSFAGNVFGKECNSTRTCSGPPANVDCNEDADCITAGAGLCTGALKTCTTDANCTQKTCSITSTGCNLDVDCPAQAQTCSGIGGNCSINADPCDVDGDCNPVAQTCRADFCKSKLNMPGQFLATTFFLGAGIDCTQSLTDGMVYSPTSPLNQKLQNFIRANNGLGIGGDTPAFGSVNPTTGGRVPVRKAISGGGTYSDGSSSGSYTYANSAGSFITNFGSGQQLAARNRLQGDFNEDGFRDINDASEFVKAYYFPRTWQKTDPQATGTGAAGNQTSGGANDNAIPEVIGDHNGDGNLSKEDLRYFMDGLATVGGVLNRKQGAIAIDTALATYGRCNGDGTVVCRLGVDVDCTDHGTTGPCNAAQPYPWADSANLLLTPQGLGLDPKFPVAKDVNDGVEPMLATGKVYVAGDFRGDVAGRSPVPGAGPVGWDGFVDDQDIDYCCRMAQVGSWGEINDAVFMDLSCDMNGDREVNAADVDELVQVILGTLVGDVNFDGVVDTADAAIIEASILNNPCNTNGTCGWADGDTNCDGFVNSADLDGFPPPAVVPQSNATCTAPGLPSACCSGLGTGVCDKSRFISFTIPAAATAAVGETAIRIKLTSLHHVVPPYTGAASIAFTTFEGQSVYVGAPVSYIESNASGTPFKASSTQCTPLYMDWSTVGLLHVTGPGIVPSSNYTVEHLGSACNGSEGSCTTFETGVPILTVRWGDVETPYNPPSATAQPDVGDISALVKKFQSGAGAVIKARGLIAGADAFGDIDIFPDLGFGHISACVDAFRGGKYPYQMGMCTNSFNPCTFDTDCVGTTGPCKLFAMGKCTGAPTPPATGNCTSGAQCTGANGAGPCIPFFGCP